MKSIETQFNEALDALDKAGKRKQFNEKVGNGMSIEAKLNAAQQVLKEVGVDVNNLQEFFESRKPLDALETFKDRQYSAYLASGMSEAAARSIADCCGKPR